MTSFPPDGFHPIDAPPPPSGAPAPPPPPPSGAPGAPGAWVPSWEQGPPAPAWAPPPPPQYGPPQYGTPQYGTPQYGHPQAAPGQQPWGPQPGWPQPGWQPQPGPWGQQPWAGPAPFPTTSGNRGAIAAVAGVVVLVLIVLGLVVPNLRSSKFPKQWDSRVLPIALFVEKTRGLPFKHPVNVDFLPDAEFNKLFAAPTQPSQADKDAAAKQVAVLRALGLAEGDIDLLKTDSELKQASVIGLYRPELKRAFVRGDQLTPDVRVTLAHELTHALQDQYFDLSGNARSSDAEVGFRALVEADANRTEQAYRATLSAADEQAYEDANKQAQADSGIDDFPEALVNSQAFPYVFGPVFLEAITHGKGTSAIDDAMRRPPSSEAEIFDPARYIKAEKAAPLGSADLGPGETQEGDVDRLGEVSLFEVLSDKIGYDEARAATASWNGDTMVRFRKDATLCVKVVVQNETEDGAAELERAGQDWAAKVGTKDPSVRRSGSTVTLTTCDPGPDLERDHPKPSPFAVLELRAQVQYEAMHGGNLAIEPATCVADGVLKDVKPTSVAALSEGDANDTVITEIRGAIQSNVARCRSGVT